MWIVFRIHDEADDDLDQRISVLGVTLPSEGVRTL